MVYTAFILKRIQEPDEKHITWNLGSITAFAGQPESAIVTVRAIIGIIW
jgi:hypothetical protein